MNLRTDSKGEGVRRVTEWKTALIYSLFKHCHAKVAAMLHRLTPDYRLAHANATLSNTREPALASSLSKEVTEGSDVDD